MADQSEIHDDLQMVGVMFRIISASLLQPEFSFELGDMTVAGFVNQF
jgi:hypothetical protein